MQSAEQHPGMVLAVEFFGSQAKLVENIGCFSQQTISRALNRENEPAAELAVAIHNSTGGVVPKWVIRPDLFDAPANAVASVEVA
ncbi:transcriptional regulator [Rhizobium rhizogenes]|jgi:DNA-binding transcriptional regulator YdaS (Cro superfamily)|uniref:transcriptional regulator n=1 Tax=Rhizobium rhizogenes TaxID=359 RepID=UPI001574C7FD|nr:YdaS family helix-turn-helix protein [Rhizobium rhizogenes]NTG94228.1 helix-turn-helix domain-containing protein [Rhizobium rhizogenes]